MDTRLLYAIKKVSSSPRRKIRVSALASEVGLSDRRLEQLSKAETGSTFAGIYRKTRMRYAAKLLTESVSPIKQIAFESGYKDVAPFCRDFLRSNGCTATEFRRTFRKSSTDFGFVQSKKVDRQNAA